MASTVTVAVRNTGERAGAEVVQLYVRERAPRLRRPDKELRAFAKPELEPGEQRELTFRLEPRDFASYDTRVAAWRTDSGEFDFLVGASSRDIRLQATATLELPDAVRVPFDRLTPLRDWLAAPALREQIEPALAGVPVLASVLDAPTLDTFVADMPIAKLVMLGALDEAEARRAHRAGEPPALTRSSNPTAPASPSSRSTSRSSCSTLTVPSYPAVRSASSIAAHSGSGCPSPTVRNRHARSCGRSDGVVSRTPSRAIRSATSSVSLACTCASAPASASAAMTVSGSAPCHQRWLGSKLAAMAGPGGLPEAQQRAHVVDEEAGMGLDRDRHPAPLRQLGRLDPVRQRTGLPLPLEHPCELRRPWRRDPVRLASAGAVARAARERVHHGHLEQLRGGERPLQDRAPSSPLGGVGMQGVGVRAQRGDGEPARC